MNVAVLSSAPTVYHEYTVSMSGGVPLLRIPASNWSTDDEYSRTGYRTGRLFASYGTSGHVQDRGRASLRIFSSCYHGSHATFWDLL